VNKFVFAFLTLLFYCQTIYSQSTLRGLVSEENSGVSIPGVNVIVEGTLSGTATNPNGEFILKNIPDGPQRIIFSHIGYRDLELTITFRKEERYITVEMREESEETEEIFINATRSSRTIQDEPIRVEIIAGEEIDEKISMDPSNISMMLNESTGIQVQQTSSVSANNSFRIQGLEGRYTQLLKDGFPLYSGFSGTLSIVQIPPLDLRQIEIIKGSSSVLYGGGAIAGLINLITKKPEEEREISFLANATSALGLDLSGYYSEKFDDFGVTILASRNLQKVYDNNEDDFSDIPEINRYSINPAIFLYLSENSTLETGFDISTEERIGGNVPEIKGDLNDTLNGYTENNKSDRISGRLRYNLKMGEDQLTLKYSLGYFLREIGLPEFLFKGRQLSSYGEAVYSLKGERSNWIFGMNLITEKFSDLAVETTDLGYDYLTAGIFVMNSFDISNKVILETGLRTDYNKKDGWFLLPGASMLIKITEKFSGRIGGGTGYKIPTIFTESSEEIFFRNILPLNRDLVNAEKSWGVNFDLNYRTILFNSITLSANQLFFYTRINDPLILENSTGRIYEFRTMEGYNRSSGAETNLKFTIDHFKLFAGYAFNEVRTFNSEEFPLSPKHKIGLVLFFEEHDNYRIGLEAYYTGKQKLTMGGYSEPYWINGLMIEKQFENISLFLNFENFLDVKQSDYGPLFSGSPGNPVFAEVFVPTEGRVINGGIKLRL
jgi:outer membrane receptor for ferrienterochelin and colicins